MASRKSAPKPQPKAQPQAVSKALARRVEQVARGLKNEDITPRAVAARKPAGRVDKFAPWRGDATAPGGKPRGGINDAVDRGARSNASSSVAKPKRKAK